jgi:oxygen-independent coproporphyrinogen-3 oxidase
MTPETVARFSAPVPRYTSYPTAPHFSRKVGTLQYLDWLTRLAAHSTLSLYVHIPYCRSLCWYCGCNTKGTSKYEPVQRYLETLEAEIGNVAALIPRDHRSTHIHWGGGSPNILSPSDIGRLAAKLRAAFNFDAKAEFAVEIDPRTLTPEQVSAFAAAGVNRVSIGVQDFDPKVQAAINREQSYEQTKAAADLFRAHGVSGLNIDLVYGLPHQTRESAARTIEKVLTLEPERIALFGYAHLPARIRPQKLIDASALPGAVERFGQFRRVARRLEAAGYVQVGLDHFARKSDPLAGGGVHRNFQGYTTDTADALIGLGASAIGKLPQGYVQNATAPADYAALIHETGLATVRGIELRDEDRIRGFVIERLMCDFEFSRATLTKTFGQAAEPLFSEAEALLQADRDGFLARTGDGFRVTAEGRPFVRAICACFDSYLGASPAQHAPAV